MSRQDEIRRFVFTLRSLPRDDALTYDSDESNILTWGWACELWSALEAKWLLHLAAVVFLVLFGFGIHTAILVDLLVWMSALCMFYFTRMEKLLWIETHGAMYDEHGEVMYRRVV